MTQEKTSQEGTGMRELALVFNQVVECKENKLLTEKSWSGIHSNQRSKNHRIEGTP